MWPTAAARTLGIDTPVVLAPMGGGPSTVELAAAVSAAGGLGTLAGGYLPPGRLREEIRRLRAATDRPFGVNLFAPTPVDATPAAVEGALVLLEPYRTELGLPERPEITSWAEDLGEQVQVVLEEHVPVFSFTFGLLPDGDLERLRSAGTVTMGTATNAKEAVELAACGVDLVCAQGAEAGDITVRGWVRTKTRLSGRSLSYRSCVMPSTSLLSPPAGSWTVGA